MRTRRVGFDRAAALAALALAGCAVGPNYSRPDVVSAEAAWKTILSGPWQEARPRDAEPLGAWWELFNDPALSELETLALAGSPDVQAALARVEEARALARIDASEIWPTAVLNPSARRSRSTRSSFGGAGSFYTTLYQLPLDLSYELDLWGKVRRGATAARAAAEAEAAAYRAALLRLSADVAMQYFRLREMDASLRVLEQTLDLRQQELNLVRERYEGGLVSDLDWARARAEWAAAQTQWIAARRERAQIENALAVLCGRPANDFKLAVDSMPDVPPPVPPGLPSEVLERRPDVAEAERALAAANEEIGIAIAAFFPSISLTGSAGYSSSETDMLFDANSKVWSLAAQSALPLFPLGRTASRVEAARARYDAALAAYRESILVSFREVEDALIAVALWEEQAKAQEDLVAAADESARLSRERYVQGLVNFLEAADAERQRLQAELQARRILSQRHIAAVQLIKAIGGSW